MPLSAASLPLPRNSERVPEARGDRDVIAVAARRRRAKEQINQAGVGGQAIVDPEGEIRGSIAAVVVASPQVGIKIRLLIEARAGTNLQAELLSHESLDARVRRRHTVAETFVNVVDAAEGAQDRAAAVDQVAPAATARRLPQVQTFRLDVIEFAEPKYEITLGEEKILAQSLVRVSDVTLVAPCVAVAKSIVRP